MRNRITILKSPLTERWMACRVTKEGTATERGRVTKLGDVTDEIEAIVAERLEAKPCPSPVSSGREEREPWRDQYERDVLMNAEENHLWLNAFSCVRPTDELLLMVGREVLRMLGDSACCHLSKSGHMLDLPSQTELVLRVNKS